MSKIYRADAAIIREFDRTEHEKASQYTPLGSGRSQTLKLLFFIFMTHVIIVLLEQLSTYLYNE